MCGVLKVIFHILKNALLPTAPEARISTSALGTCVDFNENMERTRRNNLKPTESIITK